jgi:DNA-nicking Smr family endonuclease
MPDLEPLPEDKARVAPKRGRARRSERRAKPAVFRFPEPGEPLLGIAAGIQSSQLLSLRRGRIRPQAEVDLHGLRSDAAGRHLLRELCLAAANGLRCVIVIHGKGLRSSGRPVLRAQLPRWLADPELEGCVLAFAPACEADGGNGATYVLLRRERSADQSSSSSAG